MLSIIGHIRIDESKPERVKMLIASIRSFEFMKDHCDFILNLEGASVELMTKVDNQLKDSGFKHRLCNLMGNNYGKTYLELMGMAEHDYILNFLEDHFCVHDSVLDFQHILRVMEKWSVDELKASFFQVERNSSQSMSFLHNSGPLKIFDFNKDNFREYCRHYGKRFYIGVNFITSRSFAYKFWDRKFGPRPHDYEIGKWYEEWSHIAAIARYEIICAIDDDHGEPGTCLLKRNEPKFQRIYNDQSISLPASPH